MKYEYLIDSPDIEGGEFYDGVTTEKEKGFFGKERTVYKDKMISELTWLNRKGQEGWELVSILRNSASYDVREYYFKREATTSRSISKGLL